MTDRPFANSGGAEGAQDRRVASAILRNPDDVALRRPNDARERSRALTDFVDKLVRAELLLLQLAEIEYQNCQWARAVDLLASEWDGTLCLVGAGVPSGETGPEAGRWLRGFLGPP
jgi:hypothetical protein